MKIELSIKNILIACGIISAISGNVFKTDTTDYRQIVLETGESFDPDE